MLEYYSCKDRSYISKKKSRIIKLKYYTKTITKKLNCSNKSTAIFLY